MNTATQLLEQALEICNHCIPNYAYGDNEAACDMAHRLSSIGDILVGALNEAYLAKQQVEQEPVAWRNPNETYSIITIEQKETNEFQYSEQFLAAHTQPLYTQYSGSLIVHKGCKTTWANGVIEVMPVAREPLSEQAIDDLLETLGDHNNGGVAEDNIIPFVRAIEQH